MAGPPIVEIREPGREVRRRVVDRSIEVGRECEGELLADEGVSRRHLRLVPSPVALSVVDLGSRNGTTVNGVPITGRAVLEPGAVVRLGGTEIVMIGRMERTEPRAARPTVFFQAPDLLPPPPPPPSTPVVTDPSAWSALWGRVLGTRPRAGEPLFPAYTEMRSRVPLPVWHAVRAGSVAGYVALCVALFVRPAGGLFVFFKVIVPLLPILFFTAPGLWRNICPLAASNQAPRVLGLTRALNPPDWLRKRGYVIAVVLFFGITGARLAVFNASGTATGILLSVTIIGALAAGVAFKGKSGWCSSTCPLLPLQRVYGQTPFAKVPNSHCQPCVGCTKNCYDFRPSAAYQADLHEPDPRWTAPRKLFAAALPGFVLGFFTLASRGHLPLPHLYLQLAAYFLGSVGLFYAVQALLPVSATLTVAAWASVAISIFYWYAGVTLAGSLATITGIEAPWLRWPIRALVLALSLLWMARTWVKGRQYEHEAAARPGPVLLQITPRPRKAVQKAAGADGDPGARGPLRDTGQVARAAVGMSLLELAEREHQPVEAGCRMGVCGADPVAVLEGGGCLSPPDEEELSTLRRLGYAGSTRMACCARLESGPVTVSMTPEPGGPATGDGTEFDRSIVSVVVIGNGIAGVTAADFVRRGHPDCEIHVVGGESHVLYNRMGISRLVFGRSAMQGLYLLPEQWYDDHQVTAWLNTVARRIDPQTRRVWLATGDVLSYDRLILATGSTSTRPPVSGFGQPGSFVLRTASDAIAIRAWAQEHGCREAVVAGGGLLGLEAAHSLHELGLHVTILERGERLLSRQVDARASAMIHAHFAGIGMTVLYRAEARALAGPDRVLGVALKDGRQLPCGVFLAAVGIRPSTGLAQQAGVAVNRGILVSDRMETSVPGIYAAGDAAEHDGRVLGLWPIAAKQGEVAALNALGGDARLTAEIPATILKGAGIDLYSIGTIVPGAGDEVIADEDRAEPSYRWLLVSGGRAAGAIVLGHHPDVVAAATAAVKSRAEVDGATIARLRRGDWAALADAGRVSAPAGA